ncbi:His Kinase A (phospho-acceptor) domain-containing protein [Paenibacillaceae bacterium GAS479]|nr:His Kinase A (phospho-acceptor) domain-containing protein [Paenibacillaceae bacterium GAS479]
MKRPSGKTGARIRGLLGKLAFITWITACWTLAFYLVELTGWQPVPLIEHLVTTLLGFFLFWLTFLIIARFVSNRRLEVFQTIHDALRRIANGDFKVEISLPQQWDDRDRFNHLVQGINDMAADLGKMEIMRQEFISNVSHEIQSPLTSISGFASALKDESLPPAQRKHYLDIIEEESLRLSRLSENMLKLASLDSDQHPFHPESVRLDRQLRHAVLSLEPLWSSKNQDINVILDPLEAEVDDDLLHQVWINLLHNAVKFTPEGGSISVKLHRSGEEAVIAIENSGVGIPEESLPFLFDRFYKVDRARTREGGGSGLGLSISRKIMQIHGGRIEASSVAGISTVMTVTLPLRLVGGE